VYVLFTVLYWGRATVSPLPIDGVTVVVAGAELLVVVALLALLTSVAVLSAFVVPGLFVVGVAVRLIEVVFLFNVEDSAVPVGATFLLTVDNGVLDDEVTDLLAARLLLRREEIAPVPAVLLPERLLAISLLPY
jgi:hypothetical protein